MPQFEFSTVFLPQVVWLAIFFAILYFGVVNLTLPKLGRTMQAREDQVNADLDTAEKAKAAADKISTDYDAGLAQAHASARARIGEAQAAVARAIEAKLATANEALDAKAVAADQALATARTAAVSQIEGVAADAAADIVEKLTGVRPGVTDAGNAARAALG